MLFGPPVMLVLLVHHVDLNRPSCRFERPSCWLSTTQHSVTGLIVPRCRYKSWEKADDKGARLYIAPIGPLLGFPVMFLMIITPSFDASIYGLPLGGVCFDNPYPIGAGSKK